MLREKLALTEEGYKSLWRGAGVCALANIVLMAPICLFYLLVGQLLEHLLNPAVPLPDLTPYLLGIVVVLAVMFATQYWEYNATYSVVYEESARKRTRMAERLRKLPLAFFGKRDLADLTSVIMKDCADQERLFSHTMPQLFGTGASTIIMAVMLIAFDWRLALAALWPIPIALIVLVSSAKLQHACTRKKNGAGLAMNDGFQEYLENAREIRSLNLSDEFGDRLGSRIDLFERAKIQAELAAGTAVSGTQAFLRLGTATTILVGSMLMVGGACDFMTFFCFMLMVTRFYDPINIVLQSIAELMDMQMSLNRMIAIDAEPLQEGAEHFSPADHTITFEDVRFSYNDDADPVLNGVSFTAKEGEVTALVGPSGGGKSTTAKLASRFWDANAGRVLVGGVDVTTVDPETLLGHYAEVFQDVVLFDASIKENIRLGRQGATDEEVMAAARAANCDEFVSRMPQGYDTMIGENGSRLSGGERQRISIARAILKDAPIVLLDEATASLDVENESQVQRALSRLLVGKTVLVIAHRMRTVANADKVVVLKDGRVAEMGAPAELMARENGIYRHMVDLQTTSAQWQLSA